MGTGTTPFNRIAEIVTTPVPGRGRCREKRLPSSAGGLTEGAAMERARNKAKAQETADRRMHVALAITGLVLLGLALLGLASQANAARDPSASAFLEGGVKQFMQTNLAK